MIGPYSRTPYGRSWSIGQLFTQTCAGTYNIAADLTVTLISLLNLTATYVMNGYRLRTFPAKLLSATYDYSGSFVRTIGKILTGTVDQDAGLSTTASFSRTLSATYDIAGTLTKQMYVTLLGATVWAASRLRLQYVYGWEYTGDFAPGDRIIVDREALTVKLNGGNALHLVNGDLPFFQPGSNTLTYSDDEGSRTVTLLVTWRGRWL